MKKIVFLIISLFLFMPFVGASGIDVYLFHSNTCPHCKSEIEFLSTIDNINIKKYEIGTYSKLLTKVRDSLDIKESSVPLTVIGSDYVIGFNEDTKNQILDMIDSYSKADYCDIVDDVISNKNTDDCIKQNDGIYNKNSNKTISILGKKIKFDAKSISLPVISILIGFIDGFNPCAMWVLIFLISMLFNMKDKKKMWILGLTFLITSALVYLVFMLGILKIANSIGNTFKYVIGVIALLGGLVNLNSFRKSLNKSVGCQVTNKEQKKSTINKIKKIVTEQKFIMSLIGIMLLAISVNFVELACSAGLPTMFVEILSINNLNAFEYSIYMFLYILMFMIDDIVIFVIAMTTLKVTGISNKYTKYSHLIGGILMLLIGILMIFKTEWLMFNF